MATPTSRDVADGERFWFAGSEMRFWDGAVTGDQYSLNVAKFSKGWEAPLHLHHREDEALYVIAGAISVKVGDAPFSVVRSGQFVFMPRGIPHGGRMLEDGTEILGVFTPPGFENFCREQSLDFTDRAYTLDKAIDAATTADPTMERYGVEILGPLPKE